MVRLGLVRARLRLHRPDAAATPRRRAAARPRRPHRAGCASASPSPWASRGRATSSTRSRCATRSAAWPRRAARRRAARAADIDLVNLYAATPDIPPSLVGGSRQAGRSVQTVGAGALDDRARRRRPLRSRERRAHPRVHGERLRDRLPRHLARGHAAAGARCSAAATARRCARTGPARRCRRRPDRGQAAEDPVAGASGTTRDTSRSRRRASRIVQLPGSPARRARPRCPTRRRQVRRRVAEPLEGGARDRGLGRGVVDAERRRGRRRSRRPRAGPRSRTGSARRHPRPRRLGVRPSAAFVRSPAATIATMVRSPRSSCRARMCSATAVRLRSAPASTTTPRPASEAASAPPFGDGSTTGPSSSSKASRPVKLVGESEGPGSPRRPATTPPRRSASAAAPCGSPHGHGAIATPCSTAATTAVVKEQHVDDDHDVGAGQDAFGARGAPVESHLVLRLPERRAGIAHRVRLTPPAGA